MDLEVPLLEDLDTLYEFDLGVYVIRTPLLENIEALLPFEIPTPEDITFPFVQGINEFYVFRLTKPIFDTTIITIPTITDYDVLYEFQLGDRNGIFF